MTKEQKKFASYSNVGSLGTELRASYSTASGVTDG